MYPTIGLLVNINGVDTPFYKKDVTSSPILIKNKLAIISQLPVTQTFPVEVNACALQDSDNCPVSVLKGDTIIVTEEWKQYLKKIQSPDAYTLMMTPHHLWINRSYIGDNQDRPGATPDPLPVSECISAGYGNFVEILRTEVNSKGQKFHEIRTSPQKMKLSNVDPATFNWFTHPTLFGKETARRKTDQFIMNPGDGKDCYFPIIKKSLHMWIYDGYVEQFPDMPSGIQAYAVQGASVYGWNGNDFIPLRLARKPGELYHPTSWKLKTGSVIPPKAFVYGL